MTAPRVIQTYKGPGQWVDSPPGLGDFVRGSCHLFEILQPLGVELRIDVSQTEFSGLIEPDASFFHTGEKALIAGAAEYFEDHQHAPLRERLTAFAQSGERELYLSTNLGAWDRLDLPDATRDFAGKLYRFTDGIEHEVASTMSGPYEVLSVRCGDHCYHDPAVRVSPATERQIHSIIERHVLPRHQFPIVVTSDCHTLKLDLSRRYAMAMLPHQSQHGAFGNVRPVALDLCLLKHSRFNYHINAWADWWSGFSHYTSMIFRIPSLNFREPRFAREEITADGELLKDRRWWQAFTGR
jgi:hypothetical protein